MDGTKAPLAGQGIKVGIIDSGIDYTHKMLGGSGDVNVFKAMDASQDHPSFPNDKVVGGEDFAGTKFNPGSHLYVNNIPKPDLNPIDRGGHGTHVAGTVAGLGDGVNTYNGAAPAAELYALKVFGDGPGGTSDTVVIAALERAADPNGDLDITDKLDVVNLSLGGAFGKPHNLYSEAISNLVNGGVVTVAAAGNAGPIANVVGAPSTADDAISVAASIDGMDHNWKFDAVEFSSKVNPSQLAVRVEGPISTPVFVTGPVQGKLVAIGLADRPLTAAQKVALNGNVALIDRGVVSFDEKLGRAKDAGAIGVVVVNNEPGPAIGMSGDLFFNIPAVMIPQDLGESLKADLAGTDVSVQFSPSEQIERPELIDTITGFSSQGPRDLDGALKPEISAPGSLIISAAAGTGDRGNMQSGTSMAAPHIAGVAALLVQKRKSLSAKDIKSLLMNTAVPLSDANDVAYPLSRQGAGRVDAYAAMNADIVVSTPGLSLGKIALVDELQIEKELVLKNDSDESQSLSLAAIETAGLSISMSPSSLELAPGAEGKVSVTVTALSPDTQRVELDGMIQIQASGGNLLNVPVLAVANRASALFATEFNKSGEDAKDAILTLSNKHSNNSAALLFNLIGEDDRKDQSIDPFQSVACDLQSVGYRLVESSGIKVIQVAFKIYNPVTTWSSCDVKMEIDENGDGISDTEVLGTSAFGIPGLPEIPGANFVSVVMDSKKANDIFAAYQEEIRKQLPERPRLDLFPAVTALGPLVGFENSTVAFMDIELAALEVSGKAKFRFSTDANMRDVIESSDYLQTDSANGFIDLDLSEEAQAYKNLEQVVAVPGNGERSVNVELGSGDGDLVIYYPRNSFTLETKALDTQSQVMVLNNPVELPVL